MAKYIMTRDGTRNEQKWYCPNIACIKYSRPVYSALTAPKCDHCRTDLMLSV